MVLSLNHRLDSEIGLMNSELGFHRYATYHPTYGFTLWASPLFNEFDKFETMKVSPHSLSRRDIGRFLHLTLIGCDNVG